MARHNLAARSLRHLRFAHRMMVSQPLLARASHMSHPPTSILLDGYQLPVGRILRRLPLNDTTWSVDGAESEVDAAPAVDEAAPAETWLRLLPRLPETHDPDTTSATPGDGFGLPLSDDTTTSSQPRSRHLADDAPPAPSASPAMPPARAVGLRPRSRIVELPGTVSLPVEEPSAEEPSAPGIPEESPEDVPANARAESVEDAHETTGSEPGQQLLALEANERLTTVGQVPAKIAVEHVTPVPPAAPASTSTPRRRSKQPSPTSPRASDALFPPTDADRSPAAWLARLQHTEKPTSPARPEPPDAPVKPGSEPPPAPAQRSTARGSRKGATKAQTSTPPAPDMHTKQAASSDSTVTSSPEQSAPAEQPATLPASSRTLLHTLTGVDPASVRVYRGPVAERAASAQNADALTDGGAIALGAGHATDSPETLGLLAHELTHVAQRRSPRFVPPVAISQTQHHQQTARAGTSATIRQTSQPAASPADEETQARQVEARVTRVARGTPMPPYAIQPALPVESDATIPPAREMPSRPDTRTVWGNLPAPWEPLPDWMAPSTEPSASAPQPAPQAHPRPASSASARAPAANTPSTQRAERGRSLPTEAEESSPAHTREIAAPEPDLDQLAQQVHAILKRRLAAERRRFG